MRSLVDHLLPFQRTAVTTGGLVTATAVTSATGFAFWWIAAHQFTIEAVGIAGAAISAMIILSQLAELGLGTKIVGILHLDDDPLSLAVTALVAASLTGVVLGIGFVVIAPIFFREFDPLRSGVVPIVAFAGGVGLSAGASVLDQHLVALARNGIRLLRNIVFGLSRLAVLPLVALANPNGGAAIYGAWVVGIALSFAVFGLDLRAASWSKATSFAWSRLGRMAGDSLSHHVVNLSRSWGTWILPLVVTVTVSERANGSFYIALLIANFVALLISSSTFTLYVVGAQQPDALGHQMKFTLTVSLLASLLSVITLAIAGRLILSSFGDPYTDDAYPAAVVLAASTLPMAVRDHWITIQRIRGKVRAAATVGVLTFTAELAVAAVGAVVAGVIGLAIGRFIVLLLEAGAMLPVVINAARGHSGAGQPVPSGMAFSDDAEHS